MEPKFGIDLFLEGTYHHNKIKLCPCKELSFSLDMDINYAFHVDQYDHFKEGQNLILRIIMRVIIGICIGETSIRSNSMVIKLTIMKTFHIESQA